MSKKSKREKAAVFLILIAAMGILVHAAILSARGMLLPLLPGQGFTLSLIHIFAMTSLVDAGVSGPANLDAVFLVCFKTFNQAVYQLSRLLHVMGRSVSYTHLSGMYR